MIDKNLLKKINFYLKNKKNKLICIDGITCSGKSYFSNILFKYLKVKNKNVHLISKDLFLLSRNKRIKLLKKFINQINYNQDILHYDQKKIKKIIYAIKNNKKIILRGLYDRNNGNNNKKMAFNFKKSNIIIFEGLYSLKNFEKNLKDTCKILIQENIYISLIRKIKRIRDKKISIQNVISEFTNLHLSSYYNYLKKFKFDIHIELSNKKFVKSNLDKKKQIIFIKSFQNKHLFKKYLMKIKN